MTVLFVESFSLDSGRIDFPIQIATIRMGLSIICFKGSKVDFPNKCKLQSLNIAFIIASSAETLMKCSKLPNYPFRGFKYTNGLFPIIRRVQSSNAPGTKNIKKSSCLNPLDLEP